MADILFNETNCLINKSRVLIMEVFMNKGTLQRKLEAISFMDVNGRILRNLNTLKNNSCMLKDFENLFYDASKSLETKRHNFCCSLRYLNEGRYITLNNTVSGKATELDEEVFDDIEIKLAPKGIQVLCGVINDDCIDV